MNDQFSLFSSETPMPLAARLRPSSFDQFYGQNHLLNKYPFLKDKNFPSLVLYGPPGTGKTTLAHLLASSSGKNIFNFNAVLGGVNELRKIIRECENSDRESILFMDEIHRFNKSQQDALLPYVEKGTFTLIGATTEYPKTSLNKALLSRVQIVELKKLSLDALLKILTQAKNELNIEIDEKTLHLLTEYSSGDARVALNLLDIVQKAPKGSDLLPLIKQNSREFDKNDSRHYDVISAFIKSMRGSDPQAALLWLAVMIDGGEDPVFIARRLVIFASEDVGNAHPMALGLTNATLNTVKNIGMPEARISLAQATTYLASTVKSNASYKAIDAALEYVRSRPTIEVPEHLKNYPAPDAKKYLYPHDYPGNYVRQNYTNENLPRFYKPSVQGREKFLKERLESLTQAQESQKQ